MKRVKALYQRLNATPDWEAYLHTLRTQYAHSPALHDELRKAKLSQGETVLDPKTIPLSVVIPFYNEEENVRPLFRGVRDVLEKLGEVRSHRHPQLCRVLGSLNPESSDKEEVKKMRGIMRFWVLGFVVLILALPVLSFPGWPEPLSLRRPSSKATGKRFLRPFRRTTPGQVTRLPGS